MNLFLEFKDLHISLIKVIDSLKPGYYIIELYCYIEVESNVPNTISIVYNYDLFDNKCLK